MRASRRKTSLWPFVLAVLALGVGLAFVVYPRSRAAAAGNAEASAWLPQTPYTLRQRFSEEFNTLSFWDGSHGVWSTTFGYGGIADYTLQANGELQLYVDPRFSGAGSSPLGLDPFDLHDGEVDIVADRAPDALTPQLWNYRYTSGLLTTRHSFAQTYGYFEVRAKLPAGKGLWPAFWLLPADGSWPPEIDVFEQLGREPHRFYVSIHAHGVNSTTPIDVPDTTDGFHKYGVLWDPEHITYYFDERQVQQLDTPPDMNKPMYILLNLAVGGNWAQAPDPSTPFPARMSVDYVRAYSLDPR